MSDLSQELVPPDIRNLVLNPGGEDSFASTWYGSNGLVETGNDDVAPADGSSVVAYTVNDQTSLPYYFTPLGPYEETHRGAFKIPSARTLSGSLNLRVSSSCWVTLQAEFLTWNGLSLVSLSVSAISTATELTGGAGWTPITFFQAATGVPVGASHWRFWITVSANDPSDFAPSPPSMGSVVYADQVMVTDSGAAVTSSDYVDGEQPGCYWEGEPFYSTSRTGTLVTDPALDEDAPPAEVVDEPDPVNTDPPEVDLDDTSPPAPPPPPPVGVDPDAPVGLTSTQAAERVIGWVVTSNNLCLKADVQVSNLVLNTMDELGNIWMVSDIEGWWTLPEPDVPDVPRGYFDGSYSVRGRYNSRVFTLTGSIIPSHPGNIPEARDRLIRAINLCHAGDWFMTHEDPTPARTLSRGSLVCLSGQPNITTVNVRGRTDFSVGLKAVDPIKYKMKDGVPPGWETVTLVSSSNAAYPGRKYPRKYPWAYPASTFGMSDISLNNEGNTTTWPILTLKGPTKGGARIINADTQQELYINHKLNSGEELVIDCQDRTVTLNGVGNFRFYLDIEADWLMLQPGANRLFFTEDIPGTNRAELTVQWRSGWIG